MRVYLAGPIAGQSTEEAGDWRNEVTGMLGMAGIGVADPFKARDYRGRTGYDPALVVEADKADIDACEVFLAYAHVPSVGTSMEILYAWGHRQSKHIVIVHPNPDWASPWLRYHCDVMFATLTEAVAYIKGLWQNL